MPTAMDGQHGAARRKPGRSRVISVIERRIFVRSPREWRQRGEEGVVPPRTCPRPCSTVTERWAGGTPTEDLTRGGASFAFESKAPRLSFRRASDAGESSTTMRSRVVARRVAEMSVTGEKLSAPPCVTEAEPVSSATTQGES